MTRISKKFLKEQALIKLYNLFFMVLSQFGNKKSFFELFDDILSPTEKIMLAKRVAVIYLLVKGLDYREISDALKVSTATVVLYATKFYKKDSKLINVIRGMLKKEKVINILDDILSDLFIQPGLQKGHWQLYWNHKRSQQERKILPPA